MGVRVSLIKLNGLQGCFDALLQISDGVIGPAIGNESGTYPTQPEMRFGQFRIEPASLAKQFSRFQMVLTRHLMKVPCPAPDQIPSRHISGVSCHRLRPFSPEYLRLDGTCHSLGNRVLNSKKL